MSWRQAYPWLPAASDFLLSKVSNVLDTVIEGTAAVMGSTLGATAGRARRVSARAAPPGEPVAARARRPHAAVQRVPEPARAWPPRAVGAGAALAVLCARRLAVPRCSPRWGCSTTAGRRTTRRRGPGRRTARRRGPAPWRRRSATIRASASGRRMRCSPSTSPWSRTHEHARRAPLGGALRPARSGGVRARRPQRRRAVRARRPRAPGRPRDPLLRDGDEPSGGGRARARPCRGAARGPRPATGRPGRAHAAERAADGDRRARGVARRRGGDDGQPDEQAAGARAPAHRRGRADRVVPRVAVRGGRRRRAASRRSSTS